MLLERPVLSCTGRPTQLAPDGVPRPGISGMEVGLMMAIFGAILPRLVLLVAWSNDQAYWNSLLGSQVWLLGGFIFFPWTTLIYGLAEPNGLSILNIIFLAFGVLIDLGTWGVGFFASREQVSNYRGT
jgi:hypothetical protein